MNQQETVVAMAKEIQANQHTPGPWTSATDAGVDGGGLPCVRVFSQSEAEIAPANAYGDDKAQMWANARLIAAAPEMADSLKALCAIIGKMSIPDTHVAERDAYRQARALLTRIERR